MRQEKKPCVYIVASKRNGTLYIGVTSDVWSRAADHKQGLREGFAKKYGVDRLVYYEVHDDMDAAIRREKQLKIWNRAWKIRIIEGMNPEWCDLFDMEVGAVLDGPADAERLQAEPEPDHAGISPRHLRSPTTLRHSREGGDPAKPIVVRDRHAACHAVKNLAPHGFPPPRE